MMHTCLYHCLHCHVLQKKHTQCWIRQGPQSTPSIHCFLEGHADGTAHALAYKTNITGVIYLLLTAVDNYKCTHVKT